ncbi:uridine kinase [Domibacillus sp. A3M-37]|uniref:uridine kinase family protein n=1 Tax=Domibacillus sp. A3M-37 TaxID=2962037 RepID=UPI0020B6DC6D|nr:uridine kinase [Domibacillus sp. A3M-37]MCP3764973.1 uridine kinase [Domibacillus sp. A3M-37]
MIVSLRQFLTKFDRIQKNRNTLIIGIDGASASGKSTIADKLRKLDNRVVIVHMDDFYRPSEEQKAINPEVIGGNFDWKRVCEQVLTPLSHNKFGRYQRYDWDTDQMAEWHDVPTGGILIIEGCYSIRKELLPLYDVRIWIDSPKQTSLERIVQREQVGTGNRYLWENVYRPDEEKYIEVQRSWEHADLIIDGTGQIGDISIYEVNVMYESDRWLYL